MTLPTFGTRAARDLFVTLVGDDATLGQRGFTCLQVGLWARAQAGTVAHPSFGALVIVARASPLGVAFLSGGALGAIAHTTSRSRVTRLIGRTLRLITHALVGDTGLIIRACTARTIYTTVWLLNDAALRPRRETRCLR